VLQVGHVERFNPVLSALEERLTHPRFIEAHRLSPYPNRSTEIGVVLDLMIHDLEIILHLVRSPVQTVDAVGVTVLSRSIARRLPELFLSTTTRSKAFPELTPQQIEVLALVAMGKSNEAIAESLGLAAKTVSNYIAEIRGRLGVSSRYELIALARDRGITAGQG
jgi:DNA-binding NarL/FixJ family response regulator